MILKTASALVLLPAVLFLIGSLAQTLLKQRPSVTGALCWGLICIMAVFQCIAYPLFRLGSSFSLLFWCFTIVLSAGLILSIWSLARRGLSGYRDSLHTFGAQVRELPLLFLVMFGIVFLYLFLEFAFPYADRDDAYYVTRAAQVLHYDTLQIHNPISWLGWEQAGWNRDSDASTLEFFKAYLSRCTGIDVLPLCRNVLGPVFSIISLMTYYNLAGTLAGKRGNKAKIQAFSLIFYAILTFFGSLYHDSAAYWSFRFIWQGKALICGFILPLLMQVCAKILSHDQEPIDRIFWIQTGLILCAGVFCSVIGVFLPFIAYLTIGLPYLIRLGWKRFWQLLPSIILSCLPVIIFAGLTLLDVTTANSVYFSFYEQPSWLEVFLKMFRPCFYLCLPAYLWGLWTVFRKGTTLEKLVLLAAPATLLLTFLNPLLIGPVSKYVTTGTVYFRMYWILPIWFLPAYSAALLLGQLSKAQIRTVFASVFSTCIAFVLCLMFFLEPIPMVYKVYTSFIWKTQAQLRSNYMGVDQTIEDIALLILQDSGETENPRVLVPIDNTLVEFLRQYSNDIHLVAGVRENQINIITETVPGVSLPLGHFLLEFYQKNITDAHELSAVLEYTNTDYVCLPRDTQHPLMTECGWSILATIDEWDVWKPTSID